MAMRSSLVTKRRCVGRVICCCFGNCKDVFMGFVALSGIENMLEL